MTLNQRIRTVRKEAGLSMPKFAERLGVSKDVISNQEYARVPPNELLNRAICQEFGVCYRWLLTGEGERYLSQTKNLVEELDEQYNLGFYARKILEMYINFPPDLKQALDKALEAMIAETKNVISPSEMPLTNDEKRRRLEEKRKIEMEKMLGIYTEAPSPVDEPKKVETKPLPRKPGRIITVRVSRPEKKTHLIGVRVENTETK